MLICGTLTIIRMHVFNCHRNENWKTVYQNPKSSKIEIQCQSLSRRKQTSHIIPKRELRVCLKVTFVVATSGILKLIFLFFTKNDTYTCINVNILLAMRTSKISRLGYFGVRETKIEILYIISCGDGSQQTVQFHWNIAWFSIIKLLLYNERSRRHTLFILHR